MNNKSRSLIALRVLLLAGLIGGVAFGFLRASRSTKAVEGNTLYFRYGMVAPNWVRLQSRLPLRIFQSSRRKHICSKSIPVRFQLGKERLASVPSQMQQSFN